MPVLHVDNVNGCPTQTAQTRDRCLQLLNQSGLKIIQQNIRSIAKNFNNFKNTLDESDFDVIILTECHIKNYIPVPLNSYLVNSGMKNVKTENDGVVIYAKKTLHPIYEECDLVEGNSLSVLLGKIYILAIYRAPTKKASSLNEFCKALDKALDDIKRRGYVDIFIMGDINIDLLTLRPKVYNTRNLSYDQVIKSHELITAINEPTRKDPGKDSESCLDHIMAITQLSFQPIIFDFEITDHYSTILIIKINSDDNRLLLPTSNILNASSVTPKQQYEKQLIKYCNTVEELHHVLDKVLKVQTEKIGFIKKPKNTQVISQISKNVTESINNNNAIQFNSTTVQESDVVMLRPFIDDIKKRIMYFSNEARIKHLTDNVNKCINVIKLSSKQNGITKSDIVGISKSLILHKLIHHIIANKLVSKNQYCFSNDTQSTSILTPIIEIATKQIDAGESCMVIFINFNDTMAECTKMKDKYLKQLELPKYKLNTKDMNLFKKYAFNRNNKVSELDTMSYTLFILYINSLCDLVTNGKVIAFGSELVMIFCAKHWKETFEIAEKQMTTVRDWLSNNLEHYEITKIKYVTFSNTNSRQPSSYKQIHKCTNDCCIYKSIKRCNEITYCGVIIDKHLKWESQMKNIIQQIKHLKSVVGKIANILEKSEVKDITKTFCQSILGYGIIGWGNGYKQQLDKIVKEAKKIPESYYSTNVLQDIYEMYIKEILWYMDQKNKNNNQNISMPAMKTAYGKKSIVYTGVKLYNELPVSMRNFKSEESKLSEWIKQYGIDILTDLVTVKKR